MPRAIEQERSERERQRDRWGRQRDRNKAVATTALAFALTRAINLTVSAALRDWLGKSGVNVATALAGFADTHAAEICAAPLVANGKLKATDAVIRIQAGLSANTLSKIHCRSKPTQTNCLNLLAASTLRLLEARRRAAFNNSRRADCRLSASARDGALIALTSIGRGTRRPRARLTILSSGGGSLGLSGCTAIRGARNAGSG